MLIAGVDYSTHAVDVVLVPYDDGGSPSWHRFPLTGHDAFDRTRSVADVLPGRGSVFWDDVLAVGIEEPAGRNPGFLFRVQGAVLAGIPARMLVEKWMPSQWRKLVGMPGNASKDEVAQASYAILPWCQYSYTPAIFTFDSITPAQREYGGWPQDAHDAHLIALATRQAITREQAA